MRAVVRTTSKMNMNSANRHGNKVILLLKVLIHRSVDELATRFYGYTRLSEGFNAQLILLLIMCTCIYHDVRVSNTMGTTFRYHCFGYLIVIHTIPHKVDGNNQCCMTDVLAMYKIARNKGSNVTHACLHITDRRKWPY